MRRLIFENESIVQTSLDARSHNAIAADRDIIEGSLSLKNGSIAFLMMILIMMVTIINTQLLKKKKMVPLKTPATSSSLFNDLIEYKLFEKSPLTNNQSFLYRFYIAKRHCVVLCAMYARASIRMIGRHIS